MCLEGKPYRSKNQVPYCKVSRNKNEIEKKILSTTSFVRFYMPTNINLIFLILMPSTIMRSLIQKRAKPSIKSMRGALALSATM